MIIIRKPCKAYLYIILGANTSVMCYQLLGKECDNILLFSSLLAIQSRAEMRYTKCVSSQDAWAEDWGAIKDCCLREKLGPRQREFPERNSRGENEEGVPLLWTVPRLGNSKVDLLGAEASFHSKETQTSKEEVNLLHSAQTMGVLKKEPAVKSARRKMQKTLHKSFTIPYILVFSFSPHLKGLAWLSKFLLEVSWEWRWRTMYVCFMHGVWGSHIPCKVMDATVSHVDYRDFLNGTQGSWFWGTALGCNTALFISTNISTILSEGSRG